MTVRIAETIRGRLGLCPNASVAKGQGAGALRSARTGDAVGRDVPRPENGSVERPAAPDGFTAVAIVVLAATCFFGGFVWWPALVFAVLAAGIAYVHLGG